MFMGWKTQILKMSVLPRLIYIFNSWNSPSRIFCKYREGDSKIYKGIQKKNKVRGIMLPTVKAYYSYSNQDGVVLAEG